MRLLIFALLLLVQFANAQVKVTSSKTFSIANGLVPDEPKIIGYLDGKYYMYNGRTGALTAYDKSMNITAEYKLAIAEQGEFAASLFLNNKMYVVIAVKADDKGKLVAYEVSIDGKTNEVTQFTNALSDIKTEAKPKFHLLKMGGKLEVKQSEDQSKICFYYSDYSAKKEEPVRITAIALDSKFNKLWSKKASLPFGYKNMNDDITMAVDNNGNVCAAIRNAQGDPEQSYYMHLFNSSGTMQKGSYPIQTSKVAVSIQILPDNKGNFYVAANYHTPFKDGTSGVKLMLYNCDSTKATWTKDYNYSKLYSADDRKQGLHSFEFRLTNIGRFDNGNLYLTHEQTMSYTSTYGMLFNSFSYDGNLLNSSFLPKVHTGMLTVWAPAVLKGNKLHSIYYYSGDKDFVINIDKEHGFYTISYDGEKAEKTFVPNTRVGGSLMKPVVVNDQALLIFINDVRTGALHLIDF